MSKNEYEKLFDDFLDLTEFTLMRYFNGWGLKDNQGGNLGGIESRRFTDATELLDNMDMYIEDYLVEPIEDCLGVDSQGMTWGEFAKKHKGSAGDSENDVLILDALCNHPDKIQLENCEHETHTEKIYTVVCQCYSDGLSVTSFREINDARQLVSLDSNGVEDELKKQGYTPKRIESYLCVEIYVPGGDIYYEWNIEESELH